MPPKQKYVPIPPKNKAKFASRKDRTKKAPGQPMRAVVMTPHRPANKRKDPMPSPMHNDSDGDDAIQSPPRRTTRTEIAASILDPPQAAIADAPQGGIAAAASESNVDLGKAGQVVTAMLEERGCRQMAKLHREGRGGLLNLNAYGNIFSRDKSDLNKPYKCIDDSVSNKSKCMTRLRTALTWAGTMEHQAVLIKDYCTLPENAPIGMTLGIFDNPDSYWYVVNEMMGNIGEMLAHLKGKSSNLAITTRNVILNTILPTAPPDDASDAEKEEYSQKLKTFTKELELSQGMKKQALQSGIDRCGILSNNAESKLLDPYRHTWNQSKLTPELRQSFQLWLLTECPLVMVSPNKRDTVYLQDKDNRIVREPDENGELKKVEVRKYFYTFSQHEIYDTTILHPSNGGFEGFYNPNNPEKPLIGLSSMEKLLPNNLSRMTDANKVMMGCEKCIDGREFMQVLVEFRNRLLKEFDKMIEFLRQEDRLDEMEEIRKQRQDWMVVVFNLDDDGNPVSQKITKIADYVAAMTCKPVEIEGPTCLPVTGTDGVQSKTKLRSLYKYKCCLDVCSECPAPVAPAGETIGFELANPKDKTDGSTAETAIDLEVEYHEKYKGIDPKFMVHWQMYKTIYECGIHGAIPEGGEFKTKCSKCLALPQSQRAEKEPQVSMQRIKMVRLIGEFHRLFHDFIDKEYRYHQWIVEVCGPKYCLADREPNRLFTKDPKSVFCTRDYTDRISVEYNNSPMSAGLGGGFASVGV